MGRLLKIILAGIAGVLVLAIIAGVIAALTFDPNEYKDELITTIEEETGRSVEIDGDLSLSIFPVLSVEIGSVRIGNAEGFDQDVKFLSLDRAAVSIRVLPLLLRREIKMGTVVVDSLQLNLAIDASGKSNWEDFAQADADVEEEIASAEADGVRIESFEVAGIEITNAALSYDDRQAGTRASLSNVSLTSGSVREGEPLALDGGFEFELQPDAISGELELSVVIKAADEVISVTDLDVDASIAGVTDAPLALTLDAPEIIAKLSEQRLHPGAIQFRAAGVDVEADIREFSYADSVEPQLTLSVAPFSAKRVMRELGMDAIPTADESALERLSAETIIQVRDDVIAMQDLVLQLDDTTFRGLIRVPRTENGVYRIALSGDSIDLTRYMAPPSDEEAAADESGGNVELPVELIRAFNVDGTFRLDEARLGNMVFTDAELTANAMNGKLRLYPISADFFDGGYRGDVTVDATAAVTRLSVNETIQNVSLGPLVEALFETRNVTGKINGNFKLAGNGNDLDTIRRDLDGNLSFTLLNGAYEGVDLWYQLRRARALFKKQPAPEAPSTRRTPFSNVRATGVVTDGVLKNNDFMAELPFMQLSGQGTVNLVEATVDYGLKAVVYERPEFASGATPEEIAEFTEAVIPLRISGPLSAPSVRPDIEDMLKERLKEEVGKKALKKLLGDDAPAEGENVEDAVKKKLKDLFDR